MRHLLIILLVIGMVGIGNAEDTGHGIWISIPSENGCCDDSWTHHGFSWNMDKPCTADSLYWNYQVKQIVCYTKSLYDDIGHMLIPQNETALETYKWYRINKKYPVAKSVRLTKKYYMLNY